MRRRWNSLYNQRPLYAKDEGVLPTELTSGIPLWPAGPGGGVVEALKGYRRRVNDVAARFHIGA